MYLTKNWTGRRRPTIPLSLTTLAGAAALVGVTALTTPAHAVFGGKDTPVPESWMVSLQTKGEPFCGGTLIDREWVLTAFHCVGHGEIPKDAIQLRIGSLNAGKGGTVAKVKQIVNHPDAKYDGTVFSGPDLALLKLDKPVRHAPARLNRTPLPTGTSARMLGWGNACLPEPCAPDQLQELELPLSKKSNDKLHFEDDQFRGTGPGDSGGPLVVRSGNGWRLAGVTSSGYQSDTHARSTFTDVTRYRKWIARSIK
ncbi:S1 family peptidase [Streptomyces sp. NPDC020412]|uniref:S1 family peptidase n=1 Tax=Streptomyces sp. NPDC020412 TaxID=3365073 RepID=UPI0037950B8A